MDDLQDLSTQEDWDNATCKERDDHLKESLDALNTALSLHQHHQAFDKIHDQIEEIIARLDRLDPQG